MILKNKNNYHTISFKTSSKLMKITQFVRYMSKKNYLIIKAKNNT